MTEVEDMKTVAGIDMGTQSMKVILYNWETKEIVAKTQEPVDLIAKNDGTREQKAEWYDEALTKCFAGFTEEQRKASRRSAFQDISMALFRSTRTERRSITSNSE